MSRETVNVLVVGDAGVGKSTFIAVLTTEGFPEALPPVLPKTFIPAETFPEQVSMTITDTSSRTEDSEIIEKELQTTDIVLVLFNTDEGISSMEKAFRYWIPHLKELGMKCSAILVGTKLDLVKENREQAPEKFEELNKTAVKGMADYKEVESCMLCSSTAPKEVAEVFVGAMKSVLHPIHPVFDTQKHHLKPKAMAALERIFHLCDYDQDEALNDIELNKFQVDCFGGELQYDELEKVKEVVKEKVPNGVTERGLTCAGFIFLHTLFVERGRIETTWAVLRKFGYNDYLELKDEITTLDFSPSDDIRFMLSEEVFDFLKVVFERADKDKDGELSDIEQNAIFIGMGGNPFVSDRIRVASGKKGLTLNSFLAKCSAQALINPQLLFKTLLYLGYPGDSNSAFESSRRRKGEVLQNQIDRSAVKAACFGSEKAGKSAVMRGLLRQGGSLDTQTTSAGGRDATFFASLVLDDSEQNTTVVMTEISANEAEDLLSSRRQMLKWDVAIFVFDSSSTDSFMDVINMIQKLVCHRIQIPCMLVAAKDDLGMSEKMVACASEWSSKLGISSPVGYSVKSMTSSNLYARLVSIAKNPVSHIPETDEIRAEKARRKAVKSMLVWSSIYVGVACIGLYMWKRYQGQRSSATNRNS